jgi:hypothetical protein
LRTWSYLVRAVGGGGKLGVGQHVPAQRFRRDFQKHAAAGEMNGEQTRLRLHLLSGNIETRQGFAQSHCP